MISVILCCHNSARRLPDTLRHLGVQRASSDLEWELVLVDNASSDGTAELARVIWDDFGSPVPMRIIAEPVPGLSEARRAGLLATKSPVVVFCDDDNWLAPDYLAFAKEIMASDSIIGAAGGQSTAVFEGGTMPPSWFVENSSSYAVGSQAELSGDVSSRGFLWGAGLVVRAEPLRRILESGVRALLSGRAAGRLLSGDDSEICKWLQLYSYRLYYDERLRFQHFIPQNRQTEDYLRSIKVGFHASHSLLSAYEAYVTRRSCWTAAIAMEWGAWRALLKNEAKIVIRGAQVRRTVRAIRSVEAAGPTYVRST